MSTLVAMTDHTLFSVLEWEKRDGIGISLCKWSEILMLFVLELGTFNKQMACRCTQEVGPFDSVNIDWDL